MSGRISAIFNQQNLAWFVETILYYCFNFVLLNLMPLISI